MEQKTNLEMGKDAFILTSLLDMVASFKGLTFKRGYSKAYSETFETYILNEELFAVLAKSGIIRQERPDDIFTLVDTNSQKKIAGYAPSNYWNFKKFTVGGKFDLCINLCVAFGINTEKRGIVFYPRAHSPFVSPADDLPHFRMFKALVESDDNALPVAKELAASDGSIVVTWTELGLGGIRSVRELFVEFAKGNDTIKELSRSGQVFEPNPHKHSQPGNEVYVVESVQPTLFQAWRKQLEKYRNSLNVA